MKQKHYIAGLYYRLSQEDERQGESVSIDNQRTILRKYAEEHGFEIHDEYIDDGVSGTTFQRPEVQRLLDDAKTGIINTIIVKDLSRFGRNYIEVGQYVDYVFPVKLNYINRNGKIDFNFNCGNHMRIGKAYCFSHFIQAKDIEAIVLDDIREMAQRIVLDEKTIREDFIKHNTEVQEISIKAAKKELQVKRKRTEELSRLMQLAYEDRLKGKMPEEFCLSFIQRYSEEQKKLETEIAGLEAKLTETENTMQSADEFIRNIKKYLEAPELTREMCYELLDRVVVGGHPKHTGKERVIDIVYKVDIASVLRHKLNNSDK